MEMESTVGDGSAKIVGRGTQEHLEAGAGRRAVQGHCCRCAMFPKGDSASGESRCACAAGVGVHE